MDETVLVEVYIPAAQQCFDVILPTSFSIVQIKKQLLPMLQECTNGAFISSDESECYLSRLHVYLLDEQFVKDIDLQTSDEIIIW